MKQELYNILTNYRKDDMIEYMQNHPEEFDNLAELALSDEQPYSWRAAWLMKNCVAENDVRIMKYTDKMIQVLEEKSESQQREFLNILRGMELTDEQEGILYDKCTILWREIHKKPGLRHNAMRILLKTAQKYPELMIEIEILTKNHYMDSLSPGIKHSLKRLIK